MAIEFYIPRAVKVVLLQQETRMKENAAELYMQFL